MQLFGKSAQDLNPLIAQGSEGIAALTDEAKRMGAVLSEETIAKFGAFDDSVQRLKQGAAAAQRVMGTVLLPQLQTLADDGVSLLGDFTSGLADAGGDFNKITVVLGETVGGIANLILGSLPQFVQVGMSIVSAIGGALAANLPTLISAASGIVMTLLQGVIIALPQFTDGAVQLITTLAQGIVDMLPALVEAAIQMVASLVQGIGDALPTLIPAIIEAVLLICETLFDNMDKILDAAFSIVKGLAEGLVRALPKLIEALPKLITGIINFFMQNLPMLVTMGIQLTVQLAAGLIKALPQLIAALPQIVSAILNGFGSSVSSLVEIGKNIVSGLWEGIKSMASWLASKVRDFFSNIVKSAKKALGIASPSKVFAGIGVNMGEGVGVGFTDASGVLLGTTQVSISAAIPASVVPTGMLSFSESETELVTQFACYVQHKSKLIVSISAAGVYGSSISTISTTVNGATYSGNSFSTNELTTAGSNIVRATITDSRGRTTVLTGTFEVVAYDSPSVQSVTVFRCDAAGNASNNATYAMVVVTGAISSVSSKNTRVIKIG